LDHDGLRGVTSNPAIFEKAIAGSSDYTDLLQSLASQSELDAKARYEKLAIRDIQDTADLLRPVYQATKRRDGYVSLEVSPYLARDTEGTLEEARRLWKAVGRDNVMIKVPGTPEGIPAFRQLISEGINVNVTLLFSQGVYEEIAQASFTGWVELAKHGAQSQRVLWASTGTKNPNYSDVIYVEELIGSDTVNTMPPATLSAFRDHGKARRSLTEDLEAAHDHMDTLQKVGISMNEVTHKLLEEGLTLFSEAFDKLLMAVEKSTKGNATPQVSHQTYALPASVVASVKLH